MVRWEYPLEPTARQIVASRAYVDELLYGGSAGGGKTEWLIYDVLAELLRYPGSNGVIFRRTFPDLNRPGGIIQRLLQRIPPSIGTYNAGEHVWKLANGSILALSHLQRDADVMQHWGAEYLVIGWDQLEQFTEYQYRMLLSRLRVTADLYASGARPRSIASANPGGVGHTWVKSRFIEPGRPEVPFKPEPTEDDPNPGWRLFVPAGLDDNPHVDPGYRARLERLPEDERRALLEGDWDVYTGQRFRSFRRHVHVVDPERLPIPTAITIPRGVGVDYGFDAPFAALWGAKLADGLVVVYRELYKAGLTPEEQAQAMHAVTDDTIEKRGRSLPVWIDPSTFARDPSRPKAKAEDPTRPPPGSIASRYRGWQVRRANNNRLIGVARVANGLRVRDDGFPRLLIYSTCTNLIRTLPGLVRDPKRPEDIDTDGEDHAYDALRYLLLGLDGRAKADPREPSDSAAAIARRAAAAARSAEKLRSAGF